jgi:hypothetical protein
MHGRVCRPWRQANKCHERTYGCRELSLVDRGCVAAPGKGASRGLRRPEFDGGLSCGRHSLRGRRASRRFKVGDLRTTLQTLDDPVTLCTVRRTSHDRRFGWTFAISEMSRPGCYCCPASSSSLDSSTASHRLDRPMTSRLCRKAGTSCSSTCGLWHVEVAIHVRHPRIEGLALPAHQELLQVGHVIGTKVLDQVT